jgi:hypothetical protein
MWAEFNQSMVAEAESASRLHTHMAVPVCITSPLNLQIILEKGVDQHLSVSSLYLCVDYVLSKPQQIPY